LESQHENLSHPPGHVWKDLDGFHVGLLVGLSLLLLPAWRAFLAESMDLGNLLAGAYLPAALGFLLVLRRGTVDLSVWAVMGAGGLAAARVVNALSVGGVTPGWAPFPAIGAAVLLGALVGLVNALGVHRFGRLGFLVTLVTGLAVLGVSRLLCPSPELAVPDNALDPWVSGLNDFLFGPISEDDPYLPGPLLMLRMLVVFVAWTGVLVVLLTFDSAERKKPRPRMRRWSQFASLCASGALAGISGACWLVQQGQVPSPTRLVDGLTIPVAAILAGGLLLQGPGRTKLAVISLPPALLLCNVWELMVWPITIRGYSVSLAVLGGLMLLAQRAIIVEHRYSHRSRVLAIVAMIVSSAAIALLGLWVWFGPVVHRAMLMFALAAGLAGAAMLGITVRFAQRHPEEKIPTNENDKFTNDK
jgi:hypothetical protein